MTTIRHGWAAAGLAIAAAVVVGDRVAALRPPIDVASYWIGLGFTWHFDRQPTAGRSSGS